MAQTERITFKNYEGIELAGRLELPDFSPNFFAIFAHCFTCSKDIAAASRISKGLTDHGVGVLRFDFTGLGNSEGDFSNSNFSSNVQDLIAANTFLSEHYEGAKLLIGHSLGGAAVIMAANELPEAKAIATIGAPFDPKHVSRNFQADLKTIEKTGSAKVKLGMREFTIKKQFLEDLQSQDAIDSIQNLGKALLIFHSPQDDIVAIQNAQDIYMKARHPKSFISLDGADHLLTQKEDSTYVASVLASWAERYVDYELAESGKSEDSSVIVEEIHKTLSQKIKVRSHEFLADEPLGVPGGQDKGPTPYDLLLAGLGACTSMTLRMYASHKKMALEGIRVKLTHKKIHAEDCEDCESKTGYIDRIDKELEIQGDLSSEQRDRLLEISKRCPVHKTLLSELKIHTKGA